jgi:outer membrane usher protein
VNDSLTVGAAAEAGNDLINLTPRVVIVLPRVGLLNILAGASSDRDRGRGTTLGVGYQLQTRYVNYHASLSHNSPEYRTLANQQATDISHIDSSTGVSMGAPKFGTISLNSSFNESSSGLLTRSLAVSYSRALTKNMQFSASVNRTWGSVDTVNFFTGMTFFPTNNLTASALLQTSQATNKETVYLQKSLPVGDGVGYRATFEREQSQNQTFIRTNPLLQVNSSYGSYTADLQGQFNQQNGSKSGYYQISAAGAVVYAGGHVGLSRPVSSSFAVVQVEGMANVAVLLDNQEVARTNANGMAYLPMLQPYQANKIAFKDNSIAANYLIKRYTATATPGLFGGECIYFPVATVQSYGGHLLAQSGLSLEYSKVTFRGMGREFSLTTLRGGEFYFENLVDTPYEAGKRPEACGEPSPYRLTVVPGMYVVTVVTDDSERHFNMLIPASDALFVPLGDFWLSDPPE